MSLLTGTFFVVLCIPLSGNRATADETDDEGRQYEFSFNIVDFQHRYERKDKDGIITGEYGFITADGVYHETGYATDKNSDFIITKMKNRKITSLKDAQEVFKDRPEAAKKLLEAVRTSCSGCRIPAKPSKPNETRPAVRQQVGPIPRTMATVLSGSLKHGVSGKDNAQPTAGEKLSESPRGPPMDSGAQVVGDMVDGGKKNDGVLDKLANDLYYRFNYTITSHGHHEDGYRGGKKDGGYRAQSENGVETQVRYLSNEFGHQPNITFVPRPGGTDVGRALKGYSFLWFWP